MVNQYLIREPRIFHRKSLVSSIQGVQITGYSHSLARLDPQFVPLQRINSKWFKELNIRSETIHIFEKKNIGQKQIKIGFGNYFLDIIGKVKALKAKNSILALHQTRKPLHSIRSKMKGNLQNERKYLQTMYLIRV